LTKKIAIFTEGKTEQILACKLIEYYAGEKPYHLSKKVANGGRKFELIEISLSFEGVSEYQLHDFYFLVLNCANEDKVVSMLRDRIDGLINSGYTQVIGIRDLRPNFDYDELEKLHSGSMKNFDEKTTKPLIVIARMEIEAWFIAENQHFNKIDKSLTTELILSQVDVDISGDSEKIEFPSSLLNNIYSIVGKQYAKSERDIKLTVDALNLAEYSGSAGDRAPTIKPLIECIQQIFEN
jgi:hypothetical protein